MKTLNLHCDYIRFKALKKALKNVDKIAPNQKLEGEAKDCLVVLIAIEKGDQAEKSVSLLADSVKKIADQVKTKKIVLYPYAHLSNNLSSPELAVDVLSRAKQELSKNFEVISAPFGYYKEFELRVKGHPLSELSREIKINEEEPALTDNERKNLLRSISKSVLDTSKLADNDHRIIGRKMDLWSFNEVAPGMIFWHDKGLHIRNKLIEYWRKIHREAGYKEISTPQIMDKKLWEISGHWEKYKENIFITNYEKRTFAVKPMNCPGGILVYKTSTKSYRDLPLRVGELGIVHRVELSGVLGGLFRAIQFTQDDAHIFCTEEQIEDEIKKVIQLTKKLFAHFKIKISHINFSTRPEKRIGSDAMWDKAEHAIENVLKKSKLKYNLNKGDGAFYGPKIDFHVSDSLNRTWQCSTIQLDFALPERFELEYVDDNGNKKRPVMIHRTIYGSLERFIGILTEHLNGEFPFWLSPNQIKVIAMNDEVKDYAKEIYKELFQKGFQVELDDRAEPLGKKVRDAQIQRFNYILTIGNKEKKEKKIALKTRGEKKIKIISLKSFLKLIEG